mmetsp:Transcript_3158/g.9850  ORF Transcript_3158/g.9850 Transcript_3158/m.9850 type:complete len:204 (+) Transcript_3158:274-885(+)
MSRTVASSTCARDRTTTTNLRLPRSRKPLPKGCRLAFRRHHRCRRNAPWNRRRHHRHRRCRRSDLWKWHRPRRRLRHDHRPRRSKPTGPPLRVNLEVSPPPTTAQFAASRRQEAMDCGPDSAASIHRTVRTPMRRRRRHRRLQRRTARAHPLLTRSACCWVAAPARSGAVRAPSAEGGEVATHRRRPNLRRRHPQGILTTPRT